MVDDVVVVQRTGNTIELLHDEKEGTEFGEHWGERPFNVSCFFLIIFYNRRMTRKIFKWSDSSEIIEKVLGSGMKMTQFSRKFKVFVANLKAEIKFFYSERNFSKIFRVFSAKLDLQRSSFVSNDHLHSLLSFSFFINSMLVLHYLFFKIFYKHISKNGRQYKFDRVGGIFFRMLENIFSLKSNIFFRLWFYLDSFRIIFIRKIHSIKNV